MHKRLLFLLFVAAAPASAQTLSVDSVREQLASQTDIEALRRREFDLNRKGAANPEAMIERGLVLIRLHELTREDRDAKQAGNILDRAKKRMPDDPRVYYAMALSRTSGYGTRIPSPFGVLNGIATQASVAEILKRDPVSLAKNDLKHALELQPNLFGAALELAHLSLDTRDKDNMQASAVILRRMVAEHIGSVRVATALSEIEEALGNVKAAADAAATASNLVTGDNSGLSSASHARAVALLRQKDEI